MVRGGRGVRVSATCRAAPCREGRTRCGSWEGAGERMPGARAGAMGAAEGPERWAGGCECGYGKVASAALGVPVWGEGWVERGRFRWPACRALGQHHVAAPYMRTAGVWRSTARARAMPACFFPWQTAGTVDWNPPKEGAWQHRMDVGCSRAVRAQSWAHAKDAKERLA